MWASRYFSVCNNTKWQELRACILSLEKDKRPKFRSKCIANGYISDWDGEWYHHFSDGGFKEIEWFELRPILFNDTEMVSPILKIGLVGERRENALRVYGYVPVGSFAKILTIEDFGNVQQEH